MDVKVLALNKANDIQKIDKRFMLKAHRGPEDRESLSEILTGFTPDILIMDMDYDLNILARIQEIRITNPSMAVLLILRYSDNLSAVMNQALEKNFKDFVFRRPPNNSIDSGELNHKLNEIADRMSKEKGSDTKEKPASRIFTVYSSKGGTGKTMFALNLAVTLQSFSRQTNSNHVCVVDLGLQVSGIRHVVASTFRTVENHHRDISQLLDDKGEELTAQRVSSQLIIDPETGVRFLCGPMEPRMINSSPKRITQLFQILREELGFQYIIVDTSSIYASPQTLTALLRADKIFMIFNHEWPSIVSTKAVLKALHEERESLLANIFLVLNRYDPKSPLPKEKLTAFFNKAGKININLLLPSDGVGMVNAVNQLIPYVRLNSRHEITKVFLSLADDIQGGKI